MLFEELELQSSARESGPQREVAESVTFRSVGDREHVGGLLWSQRTRVHTCRTREMTGLAVRGHAVAV